MPARVLVIEPDQQLLESFRSYFDRCTDFEVRYSTGSEDCISLLQNFDPDVLVLEPAMPRGVTETILEFIGSLNDRPAVPVLVLTNRPNWLKEGHASINELHVKPQSMRLIVDRIRQLAPLEQ